MVKEFYINGEFRKSNEELEIINPFDNTLIDKVYMASEKDVEDAIISAQKGFEEAKSLKTYEIVDALEFIAEEIEENKEEMARILALEGGKPISQALGEIDRGISTFKIAAQELATKKEEVLNLDVTSSSGKRIGIVKSFSAGIVYGISSFNFPLNLVAHKVAPAIATKSPIILKPASATPLTSLKLAEIFNKTKLPKGLFQVLPMSRKVGDLLVEDKRISVLSFTGSPAIGWDLKKRASKKKVVLELGGDAALYIHKDADLDFAVEKAVLGSFMNAGQICISIQRLIVHKEIYTEFKEKFILKLASLFPKSPLDKTSIMSSLIDEKNAIRIENWVNEAKDKGVKLLTSIERDGANLKPIVLENTPQGLNVTEEEAFGPIVNLYKVENSQEGFEKINESKFGLQAGVITNNNQIIFDAFEKLDVAGIIINDFPTFRVDNMPYGGIKESGFGREGIAYAMKDFTEEKVLVINQNWRYENE